MARQLRPAQLDPALLTYPEVQVVTKAEHRWLKQHPDSVPLACCARSMRLTCSYRQHSAPQTHCTRQQTKQLEGHLQQQQQQVFWNTQQGQCAGDGPSADGCVPLVLPYSRPTAAGKGW